MKIKISTYFIFFVVLALAVSLMHKKNAPADRSMSDYEKEHEAGRYALPDEFSRERVKYEFEMLKSPVTGKIPKDILS